MREYPGSQSPKATVTGVLSHRAGPPVDLIEMCLNGRHHRCLLAEKLSFTDLY